MGGEGESPPPDEGELRRDRCPSCGGLLTFPEGREQGYCSLEDIYVEIVALPAPTSERPPLVRGEVLQSTKRELQYFCRAHGLRVSGNKTDVLTRLLRYMDDHKIDLPPEEIEEAASAAVSGLVTPAEPGEPSARAQAEEVEHLLAEVEHLAAQPEPPPPPEVEELPVPKLEQVVAPGTDETVIAEEAEIARTSEPVLARMVNEGRLRRDRRAFFVGSVLTAIGGPGLLLGSLLHDVFRVPLFGHAFEVFGPLNVTAAVVGGIILISGLAAMGLGLRGGILRADAPAGV